MHFQYIVNFKKMQMIEYLIAWDGSNLIKTYIIDDGKKIRASEAWYLVWNQSSRYTRK